MAGRFSESNLEQIRAGNDIADVVGALVPLKRAGANWVGLCPFHKEKTPSFSVNPSKQIFYCFGCHKGGDIFKFIQEYENVDFLEAVRRLAKRAGIVLETDAGPGQQGRQQREILYQVHELVTQRWQSILASNPAAKVARNYLAKRMVNAEAVSLFRLGYAPEAWDDTVNWAKSSGLDLSMVEQAGLIIRKDGEKESRYFDRFRGRLIFPIADEQGRVVAFSGRILAEEVKMAKYLNSPETPIFSKRRVFYGFDKSKRAILDSQFAVICEGQLDLIACFMSGTKNIVAPQGTAFTADHAALLKRYVNEVVLCFDSDSAGQSASVRVFDELLASDLAIRVAMVPAPHDPDSYIKAFGGEAFQQLIAQARSYFEFYLDYLCRQNDPATDRGRLAIVRAMGEALRKTGNAVTFDKFAQMTALKLGVSTQAVREEFGKTAIGVPGKHPAPSQAEESIAQSDRLPKPSAKEFWLMKYLFLDDANLEWIATHLKLNWIAHETVRKIVARRLEAFALDTWLGVSAFMTGLDDPATVELLAESLADARAIPDPALQLRDVVLFLRNQQLDRELVEITRQLSQPGLPGEQAAELLRKSMLAQQQKQQPLAPPGE